MNLTTKKEKNNFKNYYRKAFLFSLWSVFFLGFSSAPFSLSRAVVGTDIRLGKLAVAQSVQVQF